MEFAFRPDNGKTRDQCRRCMNDIRNRRRWTSGSNHPKKEIYTDDGKICANCGQVKDLSEYYKHKSQKCFSGICRGCYSIKNKKRIRPYKWKLYQKNNQKKYRDTLSDTYVKHIIKIKTELTDDQLNRNPALIEIERILLKIKRKIKSNGNTTKKKGFFK